MRERNYEGQTSLLYADKRDGGPARLARMEIDYLERRSMIGGNVACHQMVTSHLDGWQTRDSSVKQLS